MKSSVYIYTDSVAIASEIYLIEKKDGGGQKKKKKKPPIQYNSTHTHTSGPVFSLILLLFFLLGLALR